MIRRIRILAPLGLAALVLSACSGNVAATVNGTDITTDEVLGLRSAETQGSVAGEQFRNDLTTLIIGQAVVDAARDDYGIEPLETEAQRAAYLETASPEIVNDVASVEANPNLTDAAIDFVINQLYVRSLVSEQIFSDPAVLEAIWETEQDGLLQVCARHILTATQEEALVAQQRVLQGEDFSAVADEVSLDSGSPGGNLPCPSSPSGYVSPFDQVLVNATIGAPTEPFTTDFGWHIVIVDSREGPETYEEFAADPLAFVAPDLIPGAYQVWRDAALGRADVRVGSQIGAWFEQGDGILPPPASP